MKEQGTDRKRQLNNQGFSLLEVLIAIIILCIVSIPLLRAFVTAAKTNARSKITLKATSVAEDLMEDFKNRSLEELEAKYGAVYDETTGIYTFQVTDQTKFSQKLPDGYYVTLKLDPSKYSNANALNLSEFSTISSSDSAVFTMPIDTDPALLTGYDSRVYAEFADRSTTWHGLNNSLALKDFNFFKENLDRTITVSILEDGTGTDALGDEVKLVRVNVNVTYELKNYSGILPVEESKYEIVNTEMFNNTITKTKLNSIFILYNPRYLAAKSIHGDNIIIENPNNIETNLYVIAQKGTLDAGYAGSYDVTNGLKLTVLENVNTTKPDAAITLRTNLCETAPYTKKSTELAALTCGLFYENLTGSFKVTGTNAQKYLHAGDTAGKALDSEQTQARIYRVTTTVFDDKNVNVVQLDGTRLN